MTGHKSKEQLIAGYLFGELTETEESNLQTMIASGEVEPHVLDELRETLAIASLHESVEPPFGFWENFYADVVRRATDDVRRDAPAPASLHRWKGMREPIRNERLHDLRYRWVTRAAFAVAVLLIGVLLGRTVLAPTVSEQEQIAAAPAASESESASVAAGEYLGRSKTLLLGIVHMDEGDTEELNLPRRKEMARELVRTAADLKPSLDNADLRRLHELVSEVEMILVQIANMEAEHDLPAIEMVREGVERKGLLFKINVEEMRRLEARERQGGVRQDHSNTRRS